MSEVRDSSNMIRRSAKNQNDRELIENQKKGNQSSKQNKGNRLRMQNNKKKLRSFLCELIRQRTFLGFLLFCGQIKLFCI